MKITLNLDGERECELRLGEIRELQQKTGVGPLKLFQKIRAQEFLVDELMDTVRLGLIGGGMPRAEAGKFVEKDFATRPKLQYAEAAMALIAAFIDPEEPPSGKGEAAGAK